MATELCPLPSHCLVYHAVCALRFCSASVRARKTAVASSLICFVVRPNSCGLGELLAVARDICSLRPNNADQVVDCFHFVVRDLEEEGSDGLLKSCKVRVGQLFDNRLKVVKGVVEFRHDLLGCHSAPNMARPSY